MENKFYEIMASHTDEKLLEVYKNKADYTPEAREAMEQVLEERNLIDRAQLIESQLYENEANLQQAQQATYEFETFGQNVSDTEFAASKLQSGVYLEKKVSPLQGISRFSFLFIVIGASGLIFFLVFLNIGHRPKDMDTFYYLSILLAFLLPLGIWITRKSKATLKLIQHGRGAQLVIEDGLKHLSISLPFEYQCYYRWDKIRYNIKQVHLFLYIFDPVKNETIILTELLPALKDPPVEWTLAPKNEELKNKIHSYMNYGFQKPFLEEFHKLIKGLR